MCGTMDKMIENLQIVLCTILCIYPAASIVRVWFSNEGLMRRCALFVALLTTIIPLVVFYATYFMGMMFNQLNIIAVVIMLNGLVLFSTLFSKKDPKKIAIGREEKIDNVAHVVVIALGVLVLAYPYIFKQQPLVGGDSPHYLFNATMLVKDGQPPIIFDRNIVYFLPAIGHVLTGVSIETLMKGIVLTYEVLFISTCMMIAKRWLNRNLIPLFGITLMFSLALFNLSKFTIPFFMALTLMLVIVERIHDTDGISGWLCIAFLWGALFNLHGVIAFASLGILTPLVAAKAISQKISLKTWLFSIGLFFTCAQPLIMNQGHRLFAGFINPLRQTLGVSLGEQQENSIPSWKKEQTTILVDEYIVHPPKISQFPLYSANMKDTYSAIVIVCAVVGLWWILIDTTSGKRFDKSIIIWMGISLFLLTQQEFIGINWFANRFIFALAPILFIGAFYAIERIGLLIKKPQSAYYLALALIVLPTSIVGFEKITKVTANIKIEEYQFIQQIAKKYPAESTIFVAAGDAQWIQALAPQWKVVRSSFQAICGDESAKIYTEKSLWETGIAFSGNVTLSESEAIFRNYAGKNEYLVYLDTKNYRCINGNLFPGLKYPLLAEQDGLMLLEHK